MQIREVKNSVQLVRTTYSAELKRGVSKVLGTLNGYGVQTKRQQFAALQARLDAEGKALLTPAEVEQMSKWLDAKEAAEKASSTRLRVSWLPSHLDDATAAVLEAAKDPELAAMLVERAEEFWAAHARLAKAFKKAGAPKKAKPTDLGDQLAAALGEGK